MASPAYVKKDRAAANSRSAFNKMEDAEAKKAAEDSGTDPEEAVAATQANRKKKEATANKKYSTLGGDKEYNKQERYASASTMFAGK